MKRKQTFALDHSFGEYAASLNSAAHAHLFIYHVVNNKHFGISENIFYRTMMTECCNRPLMKARN